LHGLALVLVPRKGVNLDPGHRNLNLNSHILTVQTKYLCNINPHTIHRLGECWFTSALSKVEAIIVMNFEHSHYCLLGFFTISSRAYKNKHGLGLSIWKGRVQFSRFKPKGKSRVLQGQLGQNLVQYYNILYLLKNVGHLILSLIFNTGILIFTFKSYWVVAIG
jgi:hypothetical protein